MFNSMNTFHVRMHAYVFNLVSTVYVTVRASVVLRWPNFMFRCALLLYFGEHTSSYIVHVCSVARVCFNSVNHSKGQFTKTARRVQRGSPKVLAHTGTVDSCWKACKRCCQVACLAKVPCSWHMSRLGNGDEHVEMLMCTIFRYSPKRRSASWCDGKESLALWRNANQSKKRNVFWGCSTYMFEFPLQWNKDVS